MDQLDHKNPQNSFLDLLNYKLGHGARKIPAYVYLLLSKYHLSEEIGKGSVPIIFFEDLVKRPDHLEMLMKIQEKTSDITRLAIFRRRPSLSIGSLEKSLKKNIEDLWKAYLSKSRKMIIFCPHTMGGHWMQELSINHGIDVYTLQHGYYSYSEKENHIFSCATRGTKAYIFDEKSSGFFKNCDALEVVGEYLSPPRSKPEVMAGTAFHIPFMNESNADLVKSVIHQHGNAGSCFIKYHPRQEQSQVMAYLGPALCSKIESIRPGDGKVGRINHFIETSAWHGLDNDGSYQSYFHRQGHPSLEISSFNFDSAQDNLVQAIRRDMHGH